MRARIARRGSHSVRGPGGQRVDPFGQRNPAAQAGSPRRRSALPGVRLETETAGFGFKG